MWTWDLGICELSWLEIIGLLFLAHYLVYIPLKINILWLLNNCSGASAKVLKPQTPNDYAVITGASDGIGLEFTRQLAEKGFNLLLLSRTEEKLIKVAQDVQEKYRQCKQIDYLAVDFSRIDIYDRIRSKVHSLPGPVHVLVNNVGIVHNVPEYFTKFPENFHLNLINTNISSMTMMSEIVLRVMCDGEMMEQGFRKEQKKNGPLGCNGIVINVSSYLGATETPLFSTFSASKAYMIYLSKILAAEYAQYGIFVQTVIANEISTASISDLENKALAVKPEAFVKYVLKSVGAELVTRGHPKHKFINNLMPAFGALLGENLFMKFKFYMSESMRRSAEKKTKTQKMVKVSPVNLEV